MKVIVLFLITLFFISAASHASEVKYDDFSITVKHYDFVNLHIESFSSDYEILPSDNDNVTVTAKIIYKDDKDLKRLLSRTDLKITNKGTFLYLGTKRRFFTFAGVPSCKLTIGNENETKVEGACFSDIKIYKSELPRIQFGNNVYFNERRLTNEKEHKIQIQRDPWVEDLILKFKKMYPVSPYSGKKLNIVYLKNSDEIRASASNENEFEMTIHGGLAYLPNITKDSLAFVMCHEMGHMIRGKVEGEADYWAALKCLRRFYELEEKSLSSVKESLSADVSENALELCESSFDKAKEIAACLRSINAGYVFFNLVKKEKETISIATPSNNVLQGMTNAHPDYQCRLDTVVQASLCPISHTEKMSGLFDNSINQFNIGSCIENMQGARPLCWFGPQMHNIDRLKSYTFFVEGYFTPWWEKYKINSSHQ